MSQTAKLPEKSPGADCEQSPKRRQIVAAAEDLFLAHGYGAVSMDQVARTANVSKATLYAYFTSKDALFATIVSQKGLESPFGPDLFPETVHDLREVLEDIGSKLLNFMLRERTLAIYGTALAEARRFPELGQAFYENAPGRMLARFSEWMAVLEAAGLAHTPNPMIAAEQFMALMRSGVFLRRSLSVPPAPTEAEIISSVKAAVDTWIKAYGVSKT